MNRLVATLALSLIAAPALAEKPDRDDLLVFISTNQLDQNLYNLLAATVPSTPGGQALYQACGPKLIEDLFENGYSHLRKTMGDEWRQALADVYENHLTDADMARLSALPDDTRLDQISETLTSEPIIDDLRARLSPLVAEATGLHLDHMLDEAETLCKLSE